MSKINSTINRVYEGDLAYLVQFPNYILGGASHPRDYKTIFEAPLAKLQPLDALLEIELLSKRMYIDRFRLWFNNISVAREIKPFFTHEDRGLFFIKTVFDVKPLIEGKELPTYMLRLHYDGSDEVKLLKIALLLLYYIGEAKAAVAYYGSGLVLSPGNTAVIEDFPFKRDVVRARITGYAPHNSRVKIVCDSNEKEHKVIDVIDIDASCKETSNLNLENHGSGSKVIISTILLYNVNRPEPQISINVKEIEENKAILVLRNEGSKALENAIVLAIAAGNIMYRSTLETLHENEETEVAIPVRRGSINIVRVVWKYRGETRIAERKIKA